MRLLFALLLMCGAAGTALAQPRTGPWFDRTRDGHGLDLQRYGDVLVVGLFTYDATGEPEWYTAQGVPAGDAFEAPLLRFHNAGTAERPDARPRAVGTLRLRFGTPGASPCAVGVERPGASALADLDASVDGEPIRWCVEPLLPATTAPASAMDGTWWGGAGDGGWGLTTYFIDEAGVRAAVATLYAYDAAGEPRWSIAQAPLDGFRVDARWTSLRGYCRSCASTPPAARDAGPLALSLVAPRPDAVDNRIDSAASYPGAAGGSWRRSGALVRISDSRAPPRVVATREGIVAGVADAGGTTAWRGLPFAAPPVGALRLRAPQPAAGRPRVLAAADFGPGCPQSPAQGFFGGAPPTQAEDCLTLNVWAPEGARAGARLPVMVWIHGGGHVQGGSSAQLNGQLVYDGSQFARRGVVLVSINYRLGALGYGVFRDLIGEFPDQPGAGNYGLLDQVAALRWVRDNIAAFGGDPANVTVFGESAGGVSTCALLASPLARGLLTRAIVQSGVCTLNVPRLLQPVGNEEPAAAVGDRVLARLGCAPGTARDCLRAKPVADILAAAQGATGFAGSGETYGEVVDGHALLEDIGESLRNGNAAAVPLMIGVNEDEATTLVPVAQRPLTAASYETLVRSRVGALTPLVLQQYPFAAYEPGWRAWTAINSDVAFICPAARAAREHAAHGNPVYAYYLTQGLPTQPELGAFHGLDVALLFSDMAQHGPALRELAATMKALWIAFATDGQPAAPGVPAWPMHPADRALGMELRAGGIAPRADYRDAFCDFWARYVRL
jgi:para-nitrobenzyl esterase